MFSGSGYIINITFCMMLEIILYLNAEFRSRQICCSEIIRKTKVRNVIFTELLFGFIPFTTLTAALQWKFQVSSFTFPGISCRIEYDDGFSKSNVPKFQKFKITEIVTKWYSILFGEGARKSSIRPSVTGSSYDMHAYLNISPPISNRRTLILVQQRGIRTSFFSVSVKNVRMRFVHNLIGFACFVITWPRIWQTGIQREYFNVTCT